DIIRVTDALQVRTLQSAVAAYEHALETVPGHPRSRRGLARLYCSELRLARRRGDDLHEIQYDQLLREVDDGEFERELARTGTLVRGVAPDTTRRVLARLPERDRGRTESHRESLDCFPSHTRELPAGRFIVRATFGPDDSRTVAWPVRIEPGGASRVQVEAPV